MQQRQLEDRLTREKLMQLTIHTVLTMRINSRGVHNHELSSRYGLVVTQVGWKAYTGPRMLIGSTPNLSVTSALGGV